MFEKAKERYKNTEHKLLVAKTIDKYEFCRTKNKIVYTDFMNFTQKAIIEKILREEKIENYVFYGGKEKPDRSILIFYPLKITIEMLEKNYSKILKVVKIEVPNAVKFEHREYLSGIMKLGIRREKFGDIVITDYGADVIVLNEIANIMVNDLKNLTRFKKSIISLKDINELININQEYEDISIIVPSLRLDNFVSELAKCSRGKSGEIIDSGRVFINYINEFKYDKKINVNDIITIRGKGKFVFDDIEKETKAGKYLLNLRKYK